MGAKFCVECGNSLYDKKAEQPNEEALIVSNVPEKANEEANILEIFETDPEAIFEEEPDILAEEPVFNHSKNTFSRSGAAAFSESEPSTYEDAAEIWQLKQAFFDTLKKRVEEEHFPAEYAHYIERLDSSGFHDVLDINVRNIYQNIERMRKANEPNYKPETHRHIAFENLLDTFIIRHCQDLNPIPLPEKILKYQDFKQGEPLFELILDYLDLESEPEPVYLDFIKMPLKKLQTANKRFLKTEPNEKIYFICDQSIAGSCREGFAMTDRALYWRAHLLPAQRIDYRHLISVAREQDWLLINEQFFNVNPSLNLKAMKLLKKLQRTV